MITNELKSTIDKLWLEFWTNGIANPLDVIEQISLLIYAKMLDEKETTLEINSKHLNDDIKEIRLFKDEDQDKIWQACRWSKLIHAEPTTKLKLANDLFNSISKLEDKTENDLLKKYMANVQLLIEKPSLINYAVETIHKIDLDDMDLKGDLYEYLLSKLSTAGINGQFRTPRHIIETIIQLVNPTIDLKKDPLPKIIDPACGTGGFLMESYKHLKDKITEDEKIANHIKKNMLYGFDFDNTMLRVSAMNLFMHGIDNPHIYNQDALNETLNTGDHKQFKSQNYFDIVLANPPFKGSVNESELSTTLSKKVKTKKTELLFLMLILQILKTAGTGAVIVPDGVLFGSSKAHKTIRRGVNSNLIFQ